MSTKSKRQNKAKAAKRILRQQERIAHEVGVFSEALNSVDINSIEVSPEESHTGEPRQSKGWRKHIRRQKAFERRGTLAEYF